MPRYDIRTINGRSNAVHTPLGGAEDCGVIIALKGKGGDGTGRSFLRKHGFKSITNDDVVIIAPDQVHLKKINRKQRHHWDRTTEADSEHIIECLLYAKRLGANTDRALVMGWSSGGALAWHLWLYYRWAFSAVAVVGACLGRQYSGMTPPDRLPLWYQHGTADTVAPYQGDANRMSFHQALRFGGPAVSSRPVLGHGHPWHPEGEDTQERIVRWARSVGAL